MIKHMPANSAFSFNINGTLTGETLKDSPVLAPIVLHNWLAGAAIMAGLAGLGALALRRRQR